MRTSYTSGQTSDRLAALRGLVTSDVGERLYELASEVPEDQAVVEIGSFAGKSTCYLASGARAGNGAHVWAIDPWDMTGNIPGKHGYDKAHEDFARQVREMELTEQITPIQGFSVQVAKLWHGTVGLLFIDGSHVYPDVRADWIGWSRHLAPGATVAFDDYATKPNPGVTRCVDELLADGSLQDLDTSVAPLAVCRAA